MTRARRILGRTVAWRRRRRSSAAMPLQCLSGDAQFSSAVSFTMLHHIPTPALQDRLLREVQRVLNPRRRVRQCDSRQSLPMPVIHIENARARRSGDFRLPPGGRGISGHFHSSSSPALPISGTAPANQRQGELMLGSRKIVAFIPTCRPDKARSFYTDVLGLGFVADEHFALSAGCQWNYGAGSQGRGIHASVIHDSGMGSSRHRKRRVGPRAKECSDGAIRYEGTGRVRNLVAPPGGAKIAWFKDPDGNVLSVTEFC